MLCMVYFVYYIVTLPDNTYDYHILRYTMLHTGSIIVGFFHLNLFFGSCKDYFLNILNPPPPQ